MTHPPTRQSHFAQSYEQCAVPQDGDVDAAAAATSHEFPYNDCFVYSSPS